MNMVTLLGNLGADPELRQTQGGPVLRIRLATTEVYFDKDNQKQERTEWHTVTVFGRRGEALSRLLTKGSRICVNGRLHTSSYDKEGQKHYRTEIIAEDVVFAGGKSPPATQATQARAPNGASNGASGSSVTHEQLPF